jgi:Zn finger protein HypA/HybF involved in hydrogenase expression
MPNTIKCEKCKEEFITYNEATVYCEECKKEALAELDANSDECLSCQ